jgi:DNA-directed RNA polymerase subunit H
MQRKDTSEVPRSKVDLLMKFRGYRKMKEEQRDDGMDIAVLNREKEKTLIRIVTKSKLVSGNVGVNKVKAMRKTLEEGNIESGILIGRGFSHTARRKARKNRVEVISEKMIPSFNIFNHDLVPKHEILPKEDAEELLRKLRIEPYKLPRIKTLDPIVVLIGAKPGDILKVTRKSLTAGDYVTYRYVV